MRIYTLLLVIAGFAAGARAVADDQKQEMEKFKGDWGGISYVQDGQGEGQTIAAEESSILFTFEGENITIWAEPEDSPKGTFKLDPAKKPKTIDVLFAAAPGEQGQKMLGIYEFDGDTLKLCYGSDGVARPKEFKSKAGSKHILVVFKRLKK